jgi:DNA-binding transcriptional MerR regulator
VTAGRTYLSIGDVLTLLRQEFPDVTISKIRFLESQGLVNPERTPSGYRKFYEPDVERLRWVLRQQREHFLPLKVIKGRLEDGTSSAESSTRTGNGRRSSDFRASSVIELGGASADAYDGEHATLGNTVVGLEERKLTDAAVSDKSREIPDHLPGFDLPGDESLELHRAGEEPAQSVPAQSVPAQSVPARGTQHSRPNQTGKAQPGPSRPLGTSAGSTARAPSQPQATQPQAGQAHAAHVVPDRTFGGGLKVPWAGSVGTRETAASPEPLPEKPHPAGPAQSRSGAHGQVHSAKQTTPAKQAEPSPTISEGGVQRDESLRFTVAELAAAAGLTESAIEELESFGILSCRKAGGVAHFDESELAIARLAADFAQFGIEARHLRLYKHASEREAGFVEQLVVPLLKQRNPEARKRAAEMV